MINNDDKDLSNMTQDNKKRENNYNDQIISNNSSKLERKECRYCLSGDKKENLINPCQCEGTMKFVHQQCLEEWIKNRNQTISEKISDSNKKIFSTPCEICQCQMEFTKYYKNNILKSILKLIRNIFGSFKSIFNFSLHSLIVIYLIKRMRSLFDEYVSLFKKSLNFINPSFWINFIHNLTVLTSILVALNDIFSYYSKIFIAKRKCFIFFLPRIEK